MDVRIGKYRHYKGNLYEVVGVARNSEDPKEEFVVYRALYNSEEFGDRVLWVRPKSMFMGAVSKEGKNVPRFSYVGE